MKFNAFVMCVMLAFPFGMTGCHQDESTDPVNPPAPTVVKDIDPAILTLEQTITEAGSLYGLTEWAKKDPNSAKELATNLSSNITQQLLPFVQGAAKLKTVAEVQQLLQTSVFAKVPIEVKLALVSACAVLDLYVPIPEAATFMTKNQVAVVQAFLTGLKSGCDDFTGKKAGARAPAKKWLN